MDGTIYTVRAPLLPAIPRLGGQVSREGTEEDEKENETTEEQVMSIVRGGGTVALELQKAFAALDKSIKKPLTAFQKIKASTTKGVTKVFDKMKKTGKKIITDWRDGLRQMIDFSSVMQAFAPIMEPINTLLKIFAGEILKGLQPVITELFDVLLDPEIIEIMKLLGQIVAQVLVAGLRILIAIINELKAAGVFQFIIDVLTGAVEGVTWFAENLDIVWAAIVEGFMFIIDFFIMIGDSFIAAWDTIITAFQLAGQTLSDIWDAIVMAFATVGVLLQAAWDTAVVPVWDAIVGVFNWFGNQMSNIWNNIIMPAWDAIIAGFQWVANQLTNIWDAFVGGFKAVANFFIGIVNGIIDAFNAADVLDLVTDIPNVPTLQGGGIIKRAGVAVVHENEVVATREVLREAFTNAMAGGGFGGGINNSRTVEITQNAIVLDDENREMLARETRKEMIATFL
jgi:hypothetical protein